MKKTILILLLAGIALPIAAMAIATVLNVIAPAQGQELSSYYVYRDERGGVVLSNLAPADRPLGLAPGALRVEKIFRWRDATDAEIAATERSNQITARTNALNTLAQETAALARASERVAEAIGNRQQATVEINAPDIVVQGATNFKFQIPHSKFRGRR